MASKAAAAPQNNRDRTRGQRPLHPDALARQLDETGYARLPGLLSHQQCRELIDLYAEERRFRSLVDLDGHGYGEHGDYRYFARPLPRLVQTLRARLYRPLAEVANRWEERLGSARRYPSGLGAFSAECAAAGQQRPTPLLLRYGEGGLNCLHQDRYGPVAFPFQVVVLLSRPQRGPGRGAPRGDFAGGEFLLYEQRPRRQARAEAVTLEAGEGLVFPNAFRPIRGRHGFHRATIKHGMSRVTRGERYAFGLIFHDAA